MEVMALRTTWAINEACTTKNECESTPWISAGLMTDDIKGHWATWQTEANWAISMLHYVSIGSLRCLLNAGLESHQLSWGNAPADNISTLSLESDCGISAWLKPQRSTLIWLCVCLDTFNRFFCWIDSVKLWPWPQTRWDLWVLFEWFRMGEGNNIGCDWCNFIKEKYEFEQDG